MTVIYRVRAGQQLRPLDPLHVGNFYSRERTHRERSQDRQDLILYLAKLHANTCNPKLPRGMCEVKLRLTALRDWVYDYRPALDYFFEVKQLGYNVSEERTEVSTLVPRAIKDPTLRLVASDLKYEPPERPTEGIESKVFLQRGRSRRKELEDRLRAEKRTDLIEPVQWLYNQPGDEVTFVFKPAGKLQQRDTSVWPIAAIETWPAWLREGLFGPGIDIDSAYTQYLMQHLKEIYEDRPHLVPLLYPDLIALIEDKQQWRKRLCEEILGLEWNESNLSLVKTLCMSLANGSNISPAILTRAHFYSDTALSVLKATDVVEPGRLELIGERLQKVARQYARAKQAICAVDLRLHPSRHNQKRVFASYFEWERTARYLIWEAVDHHGLMVHDGLDGIPERYIEKLPQLIQTLGMGLTT